MRMEIDETQRAPVNPNSTAINELIRGRRSAVQLEALLREFLPPENRGRDSAVLTLVADILCSFSKAIDALDSEGQGSGSHSDRTARPAPSSRCGRRRVNPYECTKLLTKTMDDGYAWRKYGQKEILNFKHPRSYFRCTHKYEKRCPAKRQVQIWEQDPSMLEIAYIGEHTCRDLHSSSTIADAIDLKTTATNRDDQNVPPFSSSSLSSPSSSAYPLTFPALPDIRGFDHVVPMAQLACSALEVLPGVQSSSGPSDASFGEELLEFDDILGFDDQFGFL